MIAPAWPMRRPGGAVCPATKPTTGFFTRALINSAAADQADVSRFVNVTGHDSDFAFARRNQAGAIGANETGMGLVQLGGDTHHVKSGNAFGDADDKRQARVNRFENRVGGKRRRDKN